MTPYYSDSLVTLYCGDSRDILPQIESESVHTCVTSPPYFNLRDYGVAGQIGLEATPDEYTSAISEIMSGVSRVLRSDGTLWLNVGDSYVAGATGSMGSKIGFEGGRANQFEATKRPAKKPGDGLKSKDLIGIPWLLAFRLRSDGWYLRSDIIWAKKNCMPESVRDRPTRSHEYIFLLSKSRTYYYDAESIMEQAIWDKDGTGTAARKARAKESNKRTPTTNGIRHEDKQRGHSRRHAGFNDRWVAMPKEEQCGKANKRDVWSVATMPFSEAHFATFPPKLIEPCIKAGCPPDGIVLDPFAGAGTTLFVAKKLGRKAIGIELNEKYCEIAARRLQNVNPLFEYRLNGT